MLFKQLSRTLICGLMLITASVEWLPDTTLHAASMKAREEVSVSSGLLLSVKTSPSAQYEDHITISDPDIIDAVKRPKWQPLPTASFSSSIEVPRFTDLFVVGQGMQLRLDSNSRLWDERQMKMLTISDKSAAKLNKSAAALREKHYGHLLDWQEAEKLFSRKAVFVIKDIETGLSFRVQRRAGHDHADVQPVTKDDTEIMKQIFNNGWTWDRKAIIAEKDGKQIAASMNGMPHGGDGIPGNGMSGHFCVHFLNSSTHKSETPDLPHQLMVYKAAGKLRSYFDDATPFRLAQSLIEALHHDEFEMVRLLTEGLPIEQTEALLQQKQDWRHIRKKDGRELPQEEPWQSEVQMETETLHASRGKRLVYFHSRYVRTSPISPWELKELTVS
ncbi:hypothetical protein [Paenibacillus glycanilyticus]|uniref:Uncharacterized protein n=1 Tax=Paenibacillus glycanilyticus TaxID=126569 RepID=A0ABQ6GFY9_9BACL|nr:hypothetical protein [Paenibacillus glycanilyticus]GLX67957.1 hypothetical protein MU1_23020 [Paenibacillus glycanilyticus]